MKPVRILVDSTVDLPERCRAQVRAVPLTVHFGDEELIDGVTIDRRRFYERLIESDVLPTTSQATPAAFVKEFEAVRQAGESAVVITISAELSGTYQSACIAAADYEDIYAAAPPSDPAFWQSWRWNGRRTAWPPPSLPGC